MKMKNMLIGGMSLALVACISIGGTLAYLSDTTTEVKNTFTFDSSIDIDLKEHNKNDWNEEENEWEETSWDKWVVQNSYPDVLPNDEIQKDPTVKINKVPNTGMNLYVVVNGLPYAMTANINDTDWEKIADMNGNTVDPMFGGQNGVYKYVGDTELVTDAMIPVFTTVTVGDIEGEDLEELADTEIVINAYAVQNGSLGEDAEGNPLTQDGVAIDTLLASLNTDGE